MAMFIRNIKYGTLLNLNKTRLWGSKYTLQSALTDNPGVALRYLSNQRLQEQEDVSVRRSMLDNKFFTTERNLMRSGLVLWNHVEHLFQCVKEAGTATPSQSLFLMRCCGQVAATETEETRINLVQLIWDTYEKLDIPLDISHYNTLLNVYNENEYMFDPEEVLTTLEEKGIAPNRITYGRFITRYCQQGDIKGANKILQKMKDEEMQLSKSVFNSLILGNARAKDMEGAWGVLKLMKQSHLAINSDTYAVFLHAYAGNNDVESAKNIITECAKEELILSDKAILEAVFQFAKHDNITVVHEYLSMLTASPGYAAAAISTVHKLLSARKLEAAYTVICTLRDSTSNFLKGKMFPQSMVKLDYHVEEVAEYCHKLKDVCMSDYSFENALETYLHEKPQKTLQFLKIMKARGIEIREHYVYPLLINLIGVKDEKVLYSEVGNILQVVGSLSRDIFVSYMFPLFATIDNPVNIYLNMLDHIGLHNKTSLYNSFVEHILRTTNIKAAADFVEDYNFTILWYLRTLIVDRYMIYGDAKSAAILVRQMIPPRLRRGLFDEPENMKQDLASQLVGIKDFITRAIYQLQSRDQLNTMLLPLLQAMLEYGVGIHSSALEPIKEEIGTDITQEIEECLKSLADPSLLQKTEFTNREGQVPILQYSQGPITDHQLAGRTIVYARSGNITQAERTLEELKSSDVVISPSLKTILIDMYLRVKNLEKVELLFNEIVDDHPDFQIFSLKILDFTLLLLQNNRYQDAVKALLMHSPEDGLWQEIARPNFADSQYRLKIDHLLDAINDLPDKEAIQLLHEALTSRKYCEQSLTFSSLTKLYIKKGDLEAAFKNFEYTFNTYEIMPHKDMLTSACIDKEDTKLLQGIIDISTKKFGEINALYDLVFCFVDAGKLKQARKILQTPGYLTRQDRLEYRCKLYRKHNKITELENLIQITDCLFNVNRHSLYDILLDTHIGRNDCEKALGVWTTLQEEGLEPTDDFLCELGAFLTRCNYKVPFVIPEQIDRKDPRQRNIEDALSINDYSQVLQHLIEMLNQPLNTIFISGFEHLVCLDDPSFAVLLVKEASMRKKSIRRMLEALVSKLQIGTNSLHNLSKLIHILTEGQRMDQTLVEKIGTIYKSANKTEQFLDDMLERVKIGQNAEIISSKLMAEIMDESPEYITKVEEIAAAHNAKDFNFLYSVLMDYKYSKGQMEEAEQIHNQYLKYQTPISVHLSCKVAENNSDTDVLQRLLQIVQSGPNRNIASGMINSTLISIHSSKGNVDDAVQHIEDNLALTPLKFYKLSSLRLLKETMIAQNKEFPYKVGPDGSSSSSDSD